MYSARFINERGQMISFNAIDGIVADINLGDGVDVELGTSQGFAQTGETVENQQVSGRDIDVKGSLWGNLAQLKRNMRRVFAPKTKGKLIFQDGSYIECYVKHTPDFSPLNNKPKFMLQLYAPYPYFKAKDEKNIELGGMDAMFEFPIDYSKPHYFGVKTEGKVINAYNDGDVETPFNLTLIAEGTSSNIVITNLETFEHMKINGTLNAGDMLEISQDNGRLTAYHIVNGQAEDVIQWIDRSSNLQTLKVGDNLMTVIDEQSGVNLTARISYNERLVAVYEN